MKNFGMKRSAGKFNSFAINMNGMHLVNGGGSDNTNGNKTGQGDRTTEQTNPKPPVVE